MALLASGSKSQSVGSLLAGEGAGSDATGLVVYAINAALADVARLSGIDLVAEFYAVVPQFNPEGK
jgi:hypothetical protein